MPQTSQLIPFAPGYDPRRVIPNNTGRTYQKSTKRIFKELLAEPGGKVSGRDATRKEVVLFLAIKDAMDPAIAPVDRHRAVNMILDRIDGKPLVQAEFKHSGSLTVEHKLLSEMNADERAVARRAVLEAKTHTLIEGRVVPIMEAEFEAEEQTGIKSTTEMPSEYAETLSDGA